jgi:hypothetical protein
MAVRRTHSAGESTHRALTAGIIHDSGVPSACASCAAGLSPLARASELRFSQSWICFGLLSPIQARPRPPAARVSFLLPRTSRGKAAPSALSSATRVGSRNPSRQSRCGRALPLRVSRESEVAANETRAAGGRVCLGRPGVVGATLLGVVRPLRVQGQIGALQLSVHRRRSDKVVPDRVGDATEDDAATSPKRGGAHQAAPFNTRQRRNCCRHLLDLLFERLARAAG